MKKTKNHIGNVQEEIEDYADTVLDKLKAIAHEQDVEPDKVINNFTHYLNIRIKEYLYS